MRDNRCAQNIATELNVIEDQIKFFDNLEYNEGYNVSMGGHTPYPFLGLDEEDFDEIKLIVVNKLKDYWNKKSDEMIEFCKSQKYECLRGE